MQRNKMGKYSEEANAPVDDNLFQEEASQIPINSRCQVDGEHGVAKRGLVKFVGRVPGSGKPGYFVGVEFDEPVGKHDGTYVRFDPMVRFNVVIITRATYSVKDVKYFEARSKHASFVRPDKVTVGDYPELDLMDEDLDEM